MKLQKVLDIGISLSKESDPDGLLGDILDGAMELTNCDAGSLYVLQDNKLYFRIMKTKSKGVNLVGEALRDFPPMSMKETNICAYAAIHRRSLNIADAYESELFDFSGPRKSDAQNQYRTKSMVAIPMIDHNGFVIGVMQLINALDEKGEICSFSEEDEKIISSLASQTAICLSNMTYRQELDRQIWSFTEALTEVIDMRTPYNGSHTKNVAKYVGLIANYMNQLYEEGLEETHFTKEHISEMIMAAYLHDIGKVTTPLRVMNKKTRLEGHMEKIHARLENRLLREEVEYYKGLSFGDNNKEELKASFEKNKHRIESALILAEEADVAGFLSEELEKKIQDLQEFFTEEELTCMRVKRGTLTEEERKIMENHVEATGKILDKVYFNRSYAEAPVWAAQHHESLNGTGYPKGLKAEELSTEVRILSVADVCDALLATDRPYKKPMPKDKAFAILKSMADEGKLDLKYVKYLEKCLENDEKG